MLLGLLLQGVAIGSFVFAQSVYIFALLYVINGIGRSLYIPAQRAQIADLTKQEQQAEILLSYKRWEQLIRSRPFNRCMFL